MPQLDILLHGITTEVNITILEPHFLVGQHGLARKKRRLLRFVQDAQFLGDQLHLAGGDVFVHCVGNALLDRADCGNDVLIAQCLGLLVNGWIALFIKDYLRHSAAVTNIDKDQVAEVTPPVHPAHEYGFLAGVVGTQCAAHVSTT